jgi:acyl-CoA thioesterase-1
MRPDPGANKFRHRSLDFTRMRWFPVLLLGLALPALHGAAPARVMLFLGDSLTAGLGVAPEQAYPALLEKEFAQRGRAITVVNGGVSGDTSAGGLRLLPWLLKRKPDWVVVALGGNDMLRGMPPAETEKHLDAILTQARAAGARPVLLGMKAAPNLGPAYARDFEAIYPRLAKRHAIPYLPFYIEPVAGKPALNQADGIHPTAAGHRLIAEKLMKFLWPLTEPAR